MPTTVKKTTKVTPKAPAPPAPKAPTHPIAARPKGTANQTKFPVAKRTEAPPPPAPEPQEAEIVYDETTQSQEVSDETPGDQGADTGENDDLIPTPAVKLPPPTPTAHQATVTGFERRDFDSGAVAAVLKVTFDDNAKEDNYTIWLPPLFVSNFGEVVQDPEGTLPNEEGDKNAGVKGNMQLNQYLRNVASGDRTAVIQKLMAVAAEQGHTRKSLGIDSIPDSVDSWFEITQAILVGVNVIALCRPDRNAQDPQFANMLRVQSVISPSVLDDPKQKVLKAFNGKTGYVFAWET